MVDLRKNLAKNLKALRGERSQREFARQLGIRQPHLSRIEQAKENITVATIQKLTNRLRCSVGWLFSDDRGAPRKR